MRFLFVVLSLLCCGMTPAVAQVSVGIGLPGVSIGINLPLYPQLVQVPGYPVYYAPQVNSNYFFYDGLYWVYQGDNWYASSWYNGPWGLVGPQYVPLYVLRVPVRYYRVPPPYFRGWQSNAPPRWGEHWGNDWERDRRGWDQWKRSSAPAPAPLPAYQRQYSADRYPGIEQQQALRSQNYRYQPRDPVVRQQYQAQTVQGAPAPSQRERDAASKDPGSKPQDASPAMAPSPAQREAQAGSRSSPSQGPGNSAGRSAPLQAAPQHKGPPVQEQKNQPQQQGSSQRESSVSSGQKGPPQGKGEPQATKQGQGQGQQKGHD
jgi:hypothetical protein